MIASGRFTDLERFPNWRLLSTDPTHNPARRRGVSRTVERRGRAGRCALRSFSVRSETPVPKMELAVAKLARHKTWGEGLGKDPAKVVAVMPAKGACGATTVACNLAFQWKKVSGQRVLLADLDPLAGTLSFLLKIKSVYSFLDVLQRAHELDADLWNHMVVPVNGVDVLLSPEMLAD